MVWENWNGNVARNYNFRRKKRRLTSFCVGKSTLNKLIESSVSWTPWATWNENYEVTEEKVTTSHNSDRHRISSSSSFFICKMTDKTEPKEEKKKKKKHDDDEIRRETAKKRGKFIEWYVVHAYQQQMLAIVYLSWCVQNSLSRK